ncbi:MAG: glycosyltransferase family 4 protein [Candidatus Omnitrophica bacterium]|nr:glycosyltransferase family 4 protein [Candidatus Omnitrophota bacterium]
MKILVIHNSYYYQGGEDEVVAAEKKMLESQGHQVVCYLRSNKTIEEFGFLKKINFFFKDVFWSKDVYQEIKSLIQREKPDIAHIHNTFFVITPSVYDACYDEKLPIVQTLHNYRFLCPNALFYRREKICSHCVSSGIQQAILQKCWKNSYLKSFLLTKIIHSLQKKQILTNKVSCFIAPSAFCKQKFVENGFPAEKIFIKPNFLNKNFDRPLETRKDYALYVGALRDYKGVMTLVKAWAGISNPLALKIIGDGPLKKDLMILSRGLPIEFLGQKPQEETMRLMQGASFLIVPSECYETFSRVIIEAYACGVPVIASNIGAIKEIVEDGKTGVLFKSGDVEDLAIKIRCLLGNPQVARQMGQNAYKIFDEQYTAEKNYQVLMNIYRKAMELKQKDFRQ